MKKRFFKRMTAFVIASLMALGVFTILPKECFIPISIMVSAIDFTSANNIVDSGYCGDKSENNGENVTWVLDSDGVLTISGVGKMEYFWLNAGDPPWSLHSEVITEVIINNGVTSIGNYAFYECKNLTNITI